MFDVILCGHTGSANRGCEAIVRSTSKVLRDAICKTPVLMSHDVAYDSMVGLDEICDLRKYPKRTLSERAIGYFRRNVLNDGVWVHRRGYEQIFDGASSGDIVFRIGGDTYCRDHPFDNFAMGEVASARGLDTVLWACSIDERVFDNEMMMSDIRRYRHIVARESLSFDILSRCIGDHQTLTQACDPAFLLDSKEVRLPQGFLEHETVGLNLSPLMFDNVGSYEDKAFSQCRAFIDYVLEETSMGVCLIPHVFDYNCGSEDLLVLRMLKSLYPNEPRVSMVDGDYSCEELKHVISLCRCFVGARTHSMIAAYSSGVPALALSYSIKSLGIAKDLFGTCEGFTLPREALKEEGILVNSFSRLMAKEHEIHMRYAEMLPSYKESILRATSRIFCGRE